MFKLNNEKKKKKLEEVNYIVENVFPDEWNKLTEEQKIEEFNKKLANIIVFEEDYAIKFGNK